MLNQAQILNFLKTNKQYLATEFGVNSIALFGSYSKNSQTQNSDIDLMVDLSEPDFMKWSALLNYLQNNFNKKVDLITKGKHLNARFNKLVEHELIYA